MRVFAILPKHRFPAPRKMYLERYFVVILLNFLLFVDVRFAQAAFRNDAQDPVETLESPNKTNTGDYVLPDKTKEALMDLTHPCPDTSTPVPTNVSNVEILETSAFNHLLRITSYSHHATSQHSSDKSSIVSSTSSAVSYYPQLNFSGIDDANSSSVSSSNSTNSPPYSNSVKDMNDSFTPSSSRFPVAYIESFRIQESSFFTS